MNICLQKLPWQLLSASGAVIRQWYGTRASGGVFNDTGPRATLVNASAYRHCIDVTLTWHCGRSSPPNTVHRELVGFSRVRIRVSVWIRVKFSFTGANLNRKMLVGELLPECTLTPNSLTLTLSLPISVTPTLRAGINRRIAVYG